MGSKRMKAFKSAQSARRRTLANKRGRIMSSDLFPGCIGKFPDCPKEFDKLEEAPRDCLLCPFGGKPVKEYFESKEQS